MEGSVSAKKKILKHKQTIRRGRHVLPKYCDCGGLMGYSFGFGRVFSCCSKCTPVQKVNVNQLVARGRPD